MNAPGGSLASFAERAAAARAAEAGSQQDRKACALREGGQAYPQARAHRARQEAQERSLRKLKKLREGAASDEARHPQAPRRLHR